MEKRVIIGLAACVMVLSVLSCAKEQQKEDPQEDQNGLVTEILSATKEGDATKVTMNSSRQFGWSNLDDVAFTINKGGSYEFRTSDHYGETETNKFVVTHSGIRQGYAVMPASFQGSYDGSTLVVNYPDSYDISADVDGGCYDNAAVVNPETGEGTHFIPFPMVSVSNPESAALIFYSIGALAKVTVSNVPAGTKNLYITFNKPVTGNFPVTGLDTFDDPDPAPQVSCSGTANTTITVKISESGLASQQNITLYIPIPVCDEGLQVISSLTTPPKAALARNRGYAFATSAISSHNGGKPYFTLGGSLYEMAPGNLSIEKGVSDTWSFLDNQVKTLLSLHTTAPGNNTRDVFTFDELKTVFYNTSASETETPYPYTLGGSLPTSLEGKDGNSHNDWKLMSGTQADALIFSNTSTGCVGATSGAHYARIHVDVSVSDNETIRGYALLDESFSTSGTPKKYVYGNIFFPNDYYDITDLISADINRSGDSSRGTKSIVPYDAFVAMVNAGAIFMPAGGRYSNGSWGSVGTSAFYTSGTASQATVFYYINWNNSDTVLKTAQRYDQYRPVRLIRSVPPELGDNGVSQGDNWSWD